MNAPNAASSGEPTVISLFAGCGGSSLGYRQAGFRELLAVEWDKAAAATFRLNFPDVPIFEGDITALTGEECRRLAGNLPISALDVLDASPPCQGFSTAGKRRFNDPRNSLAGEFARLLADLQPRAFILENVMGLVKGCMKQTYLQIVGMLRKAGYRVRGEVLNAMYFGVPQSRTRVIVIGIRNDLGIEPSHPRPQTKPLSLRCALSLRRGWGPRAMGIRNAQFSNKWRSCDLPCVILEKTRPPILRDGMVERELTLAECILLAGFPMSWQTGPAGYEGLGNSVPPPLMRAIAEHVRGLLASAPAAHA